MRTFTWVCDRCGTEDRAPETVAHPKGWDQVKLVSSEKTLDVCGACAADLQGGRSGHRRRSRRSSQED